MEEFFMGAAFSYAFLLDFVPVSSIMCRVVFDSDLRENLTLPEQITCRATQTTTYGPCRLVMSINDLSSRGI